ncbi:MAG: hypothetical protein WBQ09_16400 [Terriglobales bacterium]|jgi:hypothetical protein
MTAGKRPQRATGSIHPDQIGKVFIALSQDMHQCLICEGVFTRHAASEHANVACYPVAPYMRTITVFMNACGASASSWTIKLEQKWEV